MLQQLNEDGCPVGRSTPRLKILNMWRTLCADYWAIISELQTHASNFVCGIGTEALKITFLLCQLFLYSFCQYGVPEGRCVAGGERIEEGHQTCFSCLLLFLKVSPQQWKQPIWVGLFLAIDSGFWLSLSTPPQRHHLQLGTVPSLRVQLFEYPFSTSTLCSLTPRTSSVASQGCLCTF